MFAERLFRARGRRLTGVAERGLPATPVGASPADELDLDAVIGGYADSVMDAEMTAGCGSTPPSSYQNTCNCA